MISPPTLLAFALAPYARHSGYKPPQSCPASHWQPALAPAPRLGQTLNPGTCAPSTMLALRPQKRLDITGLSGSKSDEPKDLRQSTHTQRKLSGTELFYYLAAKHHHGWGTSALCLRLQTSPPESRQIRTALTSLQGTHDMLAYHIEALGKSRFQHTEAHWVEECHPQEIPCELLTVYSDDAWQDALNDLLQTDISPEHAPLIRLKLLHNPTLGTCDVLLGFHHAVTDGSGAWHLIRAFVQQCWPAEHINPPECQALQQKNSPRQRHPSEHPFTPHATQIASMLQKTLSTLLKIFLSQLICRQAPELTIASLKSDRQTLSFERRLLPPKTVTQLVNASRREGCTLHACITASALSVSQGLFKRFGYSGTPIGYTVPVNLRDRLSRWPTHQLGVRAFAVSMLGFITHEKDESLWPLARACKVRLDNQLSSESPQAIYLLMEHLLGEHINENFILAQIPREQILINNLGKVSIPQTHTNCTYQALSWATNMGDQTPLVQFYVATLNGTLSLTVQSSRLPQEHIRELADDVVSTLNTMMNWKSSGDTINE